MKVVGWADWAGVLEAGLRAVVTVRVRTSYSDTTVARGPHAVIPLQHAWTRATFNDKRLSLERIDGESPVLQNAFN